MDGSSATYQNGNASQLADGVFVRIAGHVSGTGVVADQITFLTPPQGVTFTIGGVVSDYNSSASPEPFTLRGISHLDPAVTFSGGTSSLFVNGATVIVTGTFNGTVIDVTAVRFPTAIEGTTLPLMGVVSSLTPATGTPTSFVLNMTTVTITSSTVILNGPLADGQKVEVLAQPDATGGAWSP